MASTISEVANKLSNVLDKWARLVDSIGEWANSDSDEVTLIKPNGEEISVSSLAHILDEVEGPAGQAQDAAEQASTERQTAEAAAGDAETARSQSRAARDAAQSAETDAQKHRDDAQNAANNVANMIDTRYPDESSIRIPQSSTVGPGTTAAEGVFRWDDQYIYLMTTTGWRRVPLQDL